MATRIPYMVIGATPIWKMDDGPYRALAGMDIDGDGIGGRIDGDKYWQPTTSYKPDQDSTKVPGGVLPGIFISSVPGVVLGCRMRMTNTLTGVSLEGFCWDVGPNDKLGEATIFTAKFLGVAPSPTYGGTQDPIILYEVWPGIAAPGYTLQSYGA
jgi:hypothetical protein